MLLKWEIGPVVLTLNDINKNIKEVGQTLTKYHKTIYNNYDILRLEVGVEKHKFYVEATT